MKDSVYNIVVFLWALWYLSVLAVLVLVGRHFGLFGDYTVLGWSKVSAAFLFSLAVNFFLNPLFWIIAASCIRAAKEEGRVSRLQFYPKLFGGFLVLAFAVSVYWNVTLSKGVRPANHVIVPVSDLVNDGEAQQQVFPVVSGIMYYGDPSVLVDGQVLKTGDEINGFEVVEIRKNSVLFRDGDGKLIEEKVR